MTTSEKLIRREWFDCDCLSPHCALAITESLEETDDECLRVSISTQLHNDGFWYRLKAGLKYIFVNKNLYYSETLMTKTKADKLKKFLEDVDWSAFDKKN